MRDITHKLEGERHPYYNCSETETCQGCYERFLTKSLWKSSVGYYYCVNCRGEVGFIAKEDNHA